MIFLLGLLIGITICTFVIIVEIWLSKSREYENGIIRTLATKKRNKAQIIDPGTPFRQDIKSLIKENDKKGIDTPIDQLYEN